MANDVGPFPVLNGEPGIVSWKLHLPSPAYADTLLVPLSATYARYWRNLGSGFTMVRDCADDPAGRIKRGTPRIRWLSIWPIGPFRKYPDNWSEPLSAVMRQG